MPLLINDSTDNDLLYPPGKGHGFDPSQVTPGLFRAAPSTIKPMPKAEMLDFIRERKRLGMTGRDLRNRAANGSRVPSLNQGQVGYCWAHSVTMAMMLVRARANQPYVPLSAYSVAATVKKGRDEGGWCGLAAQFARDTGIASQAVWPQGDRDYRKYQTPEAQADFGRHKSTYDIADLTVPVYDQNFDPMVGFTILLKGMGFLAYDLNWWSHSVCVFDVDEKDGEPVPVGINSWGDEWGDNGEFTLQGQKAVPNGAIAVLTSTGG